MSLGSLSTIIVNNHIYTHFTLHIHLAISLFISCLHFHDIASMATNAIHSIPIVPNHIFIFLNTLNKIYEFVSLFRNRCHKIASDRETCPIIRETAKRIMHLYRGIEFKTLYAYLPLPTSSRCCG